MSAVLPRSYCLHLNPKNPETESQKMAGHTVPLARKSALLYRLACPTRGTVLHSENSTRISAISVKLREFGSCSLFGSYSNRLSYGNGTVLKDFSCPPGKGLGQLVSDRFLASAVSDGVSGGAAGNGGSGDGGGRSEGGGSGGNGEPKWSLLSWYGSLLRSFILRAQIHEG